MDDLYPPGHQPCQRCGVIVPWEELKMTDGWWLCSYCFQEASFGKMKKAEEREEKASEKRCLKCGRKMDSPRVLSNGEIVCSICFEDVHRQKHGEPAGIAGRILGIIDWLLGRKKGGKTYE